MGDDEFAVRVPTKMMTTRGMRGECPRKVESREDFCGTIERMNNDPCNEDGEPKELRF